MRLINADLFAKELEEYYDQITGDGEIGACSTIQDMLDEQPTVNIYKWISVEGRLPEKNGSYLVCRKFGNTHSVWIYDFAVNLSDIHDDFEDENHSGWWECDVCEGVQYFEKVKGITHWMPIPAPPTENVTKL